MSPLGPSALNRDLQYDSTCISQKGSPYFRVKFDQQYFGGDIVMMADLSTHLFRAPDSSDNLESCIRNLLDARPLLAAVPNGPTELRHLRLVPCTASGLGRVVAPPRVVPSQIVPPLFPACLLPGRPLVFSLALSNAYPEKDVDAVAAALDAVIRHLVVVVVRMPSSPSPPDLQRLVLPVAINPKPADRSLLVTVEVPALPEASLAGTVVVEELSLAGASLLGWPLPPAVRIGFYHDRRPPGAAWRAARAGSIPALLAALHDGGSTEEVDGGETCLLVAIRKGRPAMVSALLRAGAIVNEPFGVSPLCFAVSLRKADCVAALLEAPGIDVNVGRGGTVALHAGCSSRTNDECLRLILAAPGVDVDALNSMGETALHVAAAAGASVAVAMLLAAGASPNARALDGETPLHRATTAPCVKSLIAAPGVDVNAATPLGYTPLHRAVTRGTGSEAASLACLQALLAAPGLDPNPRDIGGETPLHIAALQGREWVVKALLDSNAGVDTSAVNRGGHTPQQLAEMRGQVAVAARLRLQGARTVVTAARGTQSRVCHCVVQ